MINIKKIKADWNIFIKLMKDKDEWEEVKDNKGVILKTSAFMAVYSLGVASVGLIVFLFFIKFFFKGDILYFGQVTSVASEPFMYFMMGGFVWLLVFYAVKRGWLS